MSLYNEIDRLRKEEDALRQQIESLKAKEENVKNSNAPLTNDSREEQAKVVAEQRTLVEAKLVETTELRKGYESAVTAIDKVNDDKSLNENRGEVDIQQAERDKIANQQKEREANMKTAVGVAKEYNQVAEGKFGADPLVAAAVLSTAAVKIGKDLVEKFTEKDVEKEWEKDIQKKEQAINEKFDKEVKETEKSMQKQSDYIEKKYDGQEKEDKINALKEMEEKVKADIEKDRNTELQKIEVEKAKLEQVKEATKNMEEKERQKEIERQRELERQREIERQRQLEEQNRRR